MPSLGEFAQFLTALAALGAFALSWHNSRKIEQVHKATNGMKKELVEEVRAASLAKGHKDEKDDQHRRRNSTHKPHHHE